MTPQSKIYKSGQQLFAEGDSSKSIFIIKKGAVSLRKKRGSESTEVGKALANEVLGELSFFDRRPRSASAVCIMDTEVIEISFESLEKIYSAIPDYLKTMIASLAERLRKTNEVVIRLQRENPTRAAQLETEMRIEQTAKLEAEMRIERAAKLGEEAKALEEELNAPSEALLKQRPKKT